MASVRNLGTAEDPKWYMKYKDLDGKWRHRATRQRTKADAQRLAAFMECVISWRRLGYSEEDAKKRALDGLPEPVFVGEAPRRRPSDAKDIVYFVQAASGGPVKIGWTRAGCLAQRLVGLQVGHPEELRVIAQHRGGASKEAELHARFADHRLRGEWFRPEGGLLTYLKMLRARVVV